MGWVKPNWGRDINQTAMSKKEGKNQAKFYVGILYGKDVVICKKLTGAMNSERYCNLIISNIAQGI